VIYVTGDLIILSTLLFLILSIAFFVVLKKITLDNCCIQKITKPPYTVITAKNNEDCIEGIMRLIINEMQSQENGLVKELIVVDLGSCDNTVPILQKISNEYDFVHILSKEEYINTVGD
jgi:hypothetical protein